MNPTLTGFETARHTQRELGAVAVPSDTHEYWIDLLGRIGIRPIVGLSDTVAPIVFLPPESTVDRTDIDALRRNGVSIVGDGRSTARFVGGVPTTSRVQGVCGEGPLFDGCEVVRMPATVHRLDGELASIRWVDGVPIVTIPLPAAREALARPPAMQGFPIVSGLEVHEIVSGCDHGGVRRLVQNALRQACFLRDLPFVRLGVAPANHCGVLAIRIDADDFDPAATKTVLDSLARADLRATWFIDVERHEIKGGASAVREILEEGHEVQSHFYHHYTYRSADCNAHNLRRSVDILRSWGAEPNAAATPFGTYHAGVRQALDREGIEWSSEFSAHYDDVPSQLSGRCQVPVHPVCPILLLQAGLRPGDVCDYYTNRLRQNLTRKESSIFYGHPIGDLASVPDLFLDMRVTAASFEAMTGQPIWQPTLGEFKEFHDRRRKLEWRCDLRGDRLHGACEGATPLIVESPGTPVLGKSGPFEELSTDTPPSLTPGSEGGGSNRNPNVTCLPWTQPNHRSLRRKQRTIRFRRWLRETRKR